MKPPHFHLAIPNLLSSAPGFLLQDPLLALGGAPSLIGDQQSEPYGQPISILQPLTYSGANMGADAGRPFSGEAEVYSPRCRAKSADPLSLMFGNDQISHQSRRALDRVEAMSHDIPHGDDADELVSVDHREMANALLAHHLYHLCEAILRRARYDLPRH